MLLGSDNNSSYDVRMDLRKYFCYNIPKKQLRLPSSTWPPAASRLLHDLPTQHPYDLPAKVRAPMNDSASGGLPWKGLLDSGGGG